MAELKSSISESIIGGSLSGVAGKAASTCCKVLLAFLVPVVEVFDSAVSSLRLDEGVVGEG